MYMSEWYSLYIVLCILPKSVFFADPRGRSRGSTPPESRMTDQSEDEFEDKMNQPVSLWPYLGDISRILSPWLYRLNFISVTAEPYIKQVSLADWFSGMCLWFVLSFTVIMFSKMQMCGTHLHGILYELNYETYPPDMNRIKFLDYCYSLATMFTSKFFRIPAWKCSDLSLITHPRVEISNPFIVLANFYSKTQDCLFCCLFL